MNSLEEIASVINKSKSIAIFTHTFPDFDALGSSFSLQAALRSLGKKADIFTKDRINKDQKLFFNKENINNKTFKQEDYDLLIATDLSDKKMLGEFGEIFGKAENSVILDHHECNNLIGKYNFIDNHRSSCCEIVFDLLKVLNVKIDSNMATMLFAGVSMDTSSFQNSATNAKSFQTAFELCSLGADKDFVNQNLYYKRTKKEISLEKYLLNSYKTQKDCAYIAISSKQLKKMKFNRKDCSAFSFKLITIQGINYSFSLIEEPAGLFNLSLRSKVGYNVQKIAFKLGGGGHVCAAGAKFTCKNITEAKRMVLDTLRCDSGN